MGTPEDYLSCLVFGDLERELGERIILAFDHLATGEFVLDREEQETDENYEARVSHYNKLFQ